MKKIHRFIGNFDLNADRLLIRDPELIHQMNTVLKLRAGEKIVLADGAGKEAFCSISGMAKQGVEVAVVAREESADPAKKVTLYCAVLKNDNFEFVAEKATEAGASKIVPLVTSHTVKTGIKLERLQKIVKEAAEQSGRGIVPEVTPPQNFRAAVKGAENDADYFFDLSGDNFTRVNMLAGSVGVWIGPEGGWDESETKLAREAGFEISALGRLVLRAETAATIAVYLASR
jgi:16S rRNA (uracil1498-N3)-methyltransferase